MQPARAKLVNRGEVQRKPAAAAVAERPAVTRAAVIQTSLRVSSPHDPAEREAEETARRVMQMDARAPRVKGERAEGVEVRRKAEGAPNTASNVAAELRSSAASGDPLPAGVRRFMEPRFRADFSSVRIHTGEHAARTSRDLSARAFTYGNHIFFGQNQYRPESEQGRELIAHELTHTIQQGQSVQRSPDTAVLQRSVPRVQRLGLSDALDYFADHANAIPGFRMFTIVLGVNPINMSRVDRSAANVLRAVVEFIPGGVLITRALENYGIFDRIGGWVDGQIRSLGMTVGLIRDAVMRFLNSLGWSDIFDLGGVWNRARRIFSEPIDRIIGFVRGLAEGILGFIRDAVLRPLAELAQGTRGYDLLRAILGRDPITGDAYPRNADTLIGGFMKLIGQEEVWENIKRANAVARAWAWFQGALAGVLGFVQQIPQLLLGLLQSLGIADLVLLPRVFARAVGIFTGAVSRFMGWAGAQVLSLLQIIFEVVAPGAMPYLRRAAGAFRSIVQNPVGFVGNLVRAGILGFRQFAANFLTHLRGSLISWLTGTLAGAGVYVPQAFTIPEIIRFVLSVLGLTWPNLRLKLVRVLGEVPVRALETGFELVATLITRGPAAAWQQIQEGITNLRELVMEQVMAFVQTRIVQAAITRLLTSLNPAGAFIQAVIAIYNTVMFFVERLRQIGQVAMSFIDSISAIAGGVIASAAQRVERTMGGLLTLVISFLARLVGLGRVSDAVVGIINRIRAPIDRALDRVVDWVRTRARAFLSRLLGGDPSAPPQQRLESAATEAVAAANRFAGRRVGGAVVRPLLAAIRARHHLTRLDVVAEGRNWVVEAVINPSTRRRTNAEVEAGAAEGDEQMRVGDQVQVRSPAGGWSVHPYRVTEVTTASLRYEFAGAERPASALSWGQSALSARGTSWRRLVAAAVPLPEDEILTHNGGAAGTASGWTDPTIARRVLNYRHHIHQFNPPNRDWEHVHERSGGGSHSVDNLALADRRLNQVDLNHWMGRDQPAGSGFPSTWPLTVREYLERVRADPQERTRWKLRAYRIFGVSLRPANHGRGPYQVLG